MFCCQTTQLSPGRDLMMSESPVEQRIWAVCNLQLSNCKDRHSKELKFGFTWINYTQAGYTEVLPASSSQIIIVWRIKEGLASRHSTINQAKLAKAFVRSISHYCQKITHSNSIVSPKKDIKKSSNVFSYTIELFFTSKSIFWNLSFQTQPRRILDSKWEMLQELGHSRES